MANANQFIPLVGSSYHPSICFHFSSTNMCYLLQQQNSQYWWVKEKSKNGDWRSKEEMSILRFFAQISRPLSSLLFSSSPLAFSFYYFSLLLQYIYFCTFILNYFIKNLWGKKNNVKDFSPVEPVVGTQLVFFSFGLLGTAGEWER